MTIAGVADTHAAIWYLYNDARLSSNGRAFIETTAQRGDQIGVSSITLVEMVYLIEKGKIASESLTRPADVLNDPENVFTEVSLNLSIARSLSEVDPTKVPDMPDRIIAATALHLGVPLISRDAKIQSSGLTTIW